MAISNGFHGEDGMFDQNLVVPRMFRVVFQELNLIEDIATEEEFADTYRQQINGASEYRLMFYAERASAAWNKERGVKPPIEKEVFLEHMRKTLGKPTGNASVLVEKIHRPHALPTSRY
jgi:hypothetical protein